MARLARTILLGTLAAAAGIWWLGRAYDVESSALFGFLVSSAVLVVLTIIAAVGGGAALSWLQRRRHRANPFEAFRGRVRPGPSDR